MFSLQEYQHVHLLCFKNRSFTLVWKPNPLLRSVRCAHLRARADAPSESTMGARCFCAASAQAPFTLQATLSDKATRSHSFQWRAGDFRRHERQWAIATVADRMGRVQRRDKVQNHSTLCKWRATYKMFVFSRKKPDSLSRQPVVRNAH